MNLRRAFIFFILLIQSCNNPQIKKDPKSYNSLDYSFNNTYTTAYSIKFTTNDTVYLKFEYDQNNQLNGFYYSKLNKKEEKKIDSFMNQISFLKMDTSYFSSTTEDNKYIFFFEKKGLKKYIKGDEVKIPSVLKQFGDWINQTVIEMP